MGPFTIGQPRGFGAAKSRFLKLFRYQSFDAHWIPFSAIFNGIADLKKVIAEIEATSLLKPSVILFVDEIHRFNKAQQDAFLPWIENGTITLVGATTENPSFSLNNALLSRLSVLTLNHLSNEALGNILKRFEAKKGITPPSSEASSGR